MNLAEFPVSPVKSKKEKNTLLFFSRVHPKKGIELLVEAWQQLDKITPPKLAGRNCRKRGGKIHCFVAKANRSKGLTNEIKITGPQFGEAKLDAYQRADLFVLPTYSENFGIVVSRSVGLWGSGYNN